MVLKKRSYQTVSADGPDVTEMNEPKGAQSYWSKVMPHSLRISSIDRSVTSDSSRGRNGVSRRPAATHRATSAASKYRASWAVRGSVYVSCVPLPDGVRIVGGPGAGHGTGDGGRTLLVDVRDQRDLGAGDVAVERGDVVCAHVARADHADAYAAHVSVTHAPLSTDCVMASSTAALCTASSRVAPYGVPSVIERRKRYASITLRSS